MLDDDLPMLNFLCTGVGSFGIGLGAVAVAFAFRSPAPFRVGVPSVAH